MHGKSVQPYVEASPPAYNYPPNEISLMDLCQTLIKRQRTIIAFTALVTLIAAIYAFTATPAYQAQTTFFPPSESDIQDFKEGGASVDSAYKMFQQNLSSHHIRKLVLLKMHALDYIAPDRENDDHLDSLLRDLSASLNITVLKTKVKKGSQQPIVLEVSLSATGESPTFVAEFINALAQEAMRATKATMVENMQTETSYKIRQLEQAVARLRQKVAQQRLDKIIQLETADQLQVKKITDNIRALRTSAKQQRQDRLTNLQEAAGIAHALELKDEITYKLQKIHESKPSNTSIMTNISDNASQHYTRGYKALEAEIGSLLKRTNDDPFIPKLRQLQEQLNLLSLNRTVEQLKLRKNDDPFIASLRDKESELARLRALQVTPARLTVARIDQMAYPAEQAIKPKRALIVILGLMLGLMLGIFAAFLGNFMENAPRRGDD